MCIEEGTKAADSALYQILETISEGVAIEDHRGQLVFANRPLAQILGYEDHELPQLQWTSVVSDRPQQLDSPGIDGDLALPPVYYKTRLQRKDGTTVAVEVRARRVVLGDGDVGTLSTFSELEAWSQKTLGSGQLDKMVELGQNVASVIHEVNNALAIVSLQSRLLFQRTNQTEPLSESMSIIEEQTRRMKRMMGNLRTSMDPLQPHFVPVDVHRLIRKTVDALADQLGAAGIAVRLELASRISVVPADPNHLQQIFVNLINNARQALLSISSPGTLVIETELLCDAREEATDLRIRFTDDGPGITPEALPHIFSPFFTTKEEGEGMGLGLSICDQFVRKHGGSIKASNNPARGAVFVIELPLRRPQDSRQSGLPKECLRGATQSENFGLPRREPEHVLVIDDEACVVDSLQQLLVDAGYQVSVAQDAGRALDLLAENHIDLIVSDLAMPKMDGSQLWQAVRKNYPALSNRIVFSTGDSSRKRQNAFLMESGCPWLEKPYEVGELLQVVRNTLQADARVALESR